MTIPAAWPRSVRRHVREAYGDPLSVEPLGGMSGARVYRARFPRTSLIVKGPARPGEARFYAAVAPELPGQGVAVPVLHWAEADTETPWLILEDVPHGLPRDRWDADPEVLAVLRSLHAATFSAAPSPPTAYRPAWSPRMTEAGWRRPARADGARAAGGEPAAVRPAVSDLR